MTTTTYNVLPFQGSLRLPPAGVGHLRCTTYVPCVPRYLFIDPSDGVTVQQLLIGDRVSEVSDGDAPARLYELRDLLDLADVGRVVQFSGVPVVVTIDATATWPLPLALPVLQPHLYVALRLRNDGPASVVLRAAFAVVVVDDEDATALPGVPRR